MKRKIASYGSWKSPITSDLIVKETVELGEIVLDSQDIYWLEMYPAEGGRYTVVRQNRDGEPIPLLPSPFNVRTRVHEYGGGSFVVHDSILYFVNFADQRLYRKIPGELPEPVTVKEDVRYADGMVDHTGKTLICVQEDHTGPGEPSTTLVSIDLSTGEKTTLVSGNDFYSTPQASPDGSFLTWLTWNHPNMPWDGTELWGGYLKNGSIRDASLLAGGINESVFQPQWSPDGTLYFVSDRTGWWNLYHWCNNRVESVCEMKAEFGRPQWVFNLSTYAFESAEHIICTYTQGGIWYLARVNTGTGQLKLIDTPFLNIEYVRAFPHHAVFLGSSPTESSSIVLLDLETDNFKVLRRSSKIDIDSKYLSAPDTVEFPTENGLKAHAFYYGPKNDDYEPPLDETPPLIVVSHGGPTSATSMELNLKIQYWTSRGFSVLDVNYGGSTGFGREYRKRLDGNWGVVDVNDCVNGALYLVKKGFAGDRLIIRGGSAGGYTTLCALIFHDVFKAGASFYGVSDVEALTRETHKFESHYLDRLIGPYPQCKDLYKKRSPINFVEHLSCPVIFFQGLQDKVVSPEQAEKMVEALGAKGIPVAYIAFEGEQHGFRRSENVKRAMDAELYFYSKIFNIELADPVDPVPIVNLDNHR